MYAHILVAVDGSELAGRALDHAAALAKALGSKLTIVTVTEPAESNGTLKTWFAFENGAQTGDGKSRGRESGIAGAYVWRRGRWVFE